MHSWSELTDYLTYSVKKTKIDVADQSLIIGPNCDNEEIFNQRIPEKKPNLHGRPQKILVFLIDRTEKELSPTIKESGTEIL